ncbi:molybdopterin-containing oxidoreductase family protein [Flavisphingomonas formosensis]|uniref:molybdopterin-containing oxidoreductase family protein n=1 Tax=Flavisphingomonas formosensis TaxID=861534 RepID=UPI0018DF4F26|nr:molybdopterin-dependent oxidoreductase [Sphingomonas formosensis]
MATQHVSFCRICSGGCGTLLTVEEDGRISSVRGDPDNGMTRGYACFKGLQAEAAHHGPARRLHPLKRRADGSYQRIGLEQALDEIAERIGAILAEDGGDALAVFCGNGGMFNALAYGIHPDFLRAMGSRNYFSTLTIDQSSKAVAQGRLGSWKAGLPDFQTSDVSLFFGANPLVSHGSVGFLAVDPVKRLREARANGLKLIVVDPRRTETARNADLFLQPYPGQDVGIAAALIRLILVEGWHDRDFCARYVGAEGLGRLAEAVAPFTPEAVETRAGLAPGQIRQVAEMFARDARSGAAHSATGVCMAPDSVLAHQLIETLNVICGRYLRAGERVHSLNLMCPPTELREGVVPPMRFWEAGGPSRIRGAYSLGDERPTATLTDEILTPGPGRIRALIVDGGDPVTSFPDRGRTQRALHALDLLVAIDPWPSGTSAFAHYVIPPLMQYERADIPLKLGDMPLWPGAWLQFTPPVLAPPDGAEVVNDWYVFWSIASRLGRTIEFDGSGPLDMVTPPTDEEMIDRRLSVGGYSLADLRAHPHGRDHPIAQDVVLPCAEGDEARFEVMADDVAADLRRFWEEGDRPGAITRDGEAFTHLLSTRRMRDLFNSNGRHVPTVRRRTPTNPAFLNPEDLAALDIVPGDLVEIVSAHGRVRAIAAVDADVRPGVVSMAHGWGGMPGNPGEDPAVHGAGVNELIDTVERVEPVNAMPHMSAVPVNILRVVAQSAAAA